MFKLKFNEPKKLFFIGIGGISMSGLAEILNHHNFTISGSDIKSSEIITHLKELGINVSIGHDENNISNDIDCVVHTAAIKSDNVEYQAAKEKNISIIDRAELLGQIMNNYNNSIAVSGTHGKTTTTSMLSHILLQAQKDPTISVGGILDCLKGNIRVGSSSFFITEACEYYDSFLKFNPNIAIILNIEEDHLDYFENIDAIRASFLAFSKKIKPNGSLVINGDIENIKPFLDELSCKFITFGSNKDLHDYSATNITFDEFANASFDLIYKGEIIEHIKLEVTGLHNVYNALSVIATSLELGIKMDDIKEGLLSFKGTKRRFEYKGSVSGISVIDDYAHHPTEINATLKAAKNYPHNNIWCVFQPHTYTRTKAFLKEFAASLSQADKVIITDIYAAREKNTLNVHSNDIVQELKKLGTETYYISSFDKIEKFLLENCIQGDLLITMGAGDVKIIGEELLGS